MGVGHKVCEQNGSTILQSYRIVSTQDTQLNAGKRIANCGCLRLLVGAWQVMYAKASASQILPNISCSKPIFAYGKHADGRRILKGADWHPVCLGCGTGGRVRG